ncbi:hypothetical protein FOZ62_017311 [Perkinsus olseni]|uniref:Peptidase A1 domain-containing protein n=2 Tax=Perkinsus olseni TaxID=32597 RepID=A0A7J6TB65_PEROL|nr:hypothetical protein FOZ62_017311 [Perkinsus olseni]
MQTSCVRVGSHRGERSITAKPNTGRTTLDYNVPRLYAHVVVDQQQIYAQVDTGSPELTVIWKDWYEHVTRPGSCTTLQMGCYTCPKGCDSRPTIKITYGFKEVSVFPWQGSVQLGDTVVGKLGFGVIKGQKPPPPSRNAANILGLSPDASKLPSVLTQLYGQSKVSSPTFALYLSRPSAGSFESSGELLLGGGDDTLYVKPLRFVRFSKPAVLEVKLDSLKVGNGPSVARINQDLLIDTGTNFVLVPSKYIDSLLRSIQAEASKTAGRTVKFTFAPASKVYLFDCADAAFLPTITFALGAVGEVQLTMDHAAYYHNLMNQCYIDIVPAEDNDWVLPDKTLYGNYLEFQPQNARLGIAKLK